MSLKHSQRESVADGAAETPPGHTVGEAHLSSWQLDIQL